MAVTRGFASSEPFPSRTPSEISAARCSKTSWVSTSAPESFRASVVRRTASAMASLAFTISATFSWSIDVVIGSGTVSVSRPKLNFSTTNFLALSTFSGVTPPCIDSAAFTIKVECGLMLARLLHGKRTSDSSGTSGSLPLTRSIPPIASTVKGKSLFLSATEKLYLARLSLTVSASNSPEEFFNRTLALTTGPSPTLPSKFAWVFELHAESNAAVITRTVSDLNVFFIVPILSLKTLHRMSTSPPRLGSTGSHFGRELHHTGPKRENNYAVHHTSIPPWEYPSGVKREMNDR